MPVAIRQPHRPHSLDKTTFNWRHLVSIKHPSYPDTENTLLVLPGLDHPEGGLYHATALEACGILAGNRQDGYFSETFDGPGIGIPAEGILKGTKYYFQIPRPDQTQNSSTEPYRYPIVPCFREWVFPHEMIPASWQLAFRRNNGAYTGDENMSEKVHIRDVSCRISGHSLGCGVARLCPESQRTWYEENEMFRYSYDNSENIENTDPSQNAILMRLDLAFVFRGPNFVLVPKRSDRGMKLVVHLMESVQELVRPYHNTELHPLKDVAPEFLYARFAWTVFRYFEPFLNEVSRIQRRALLVRKGKIIMATSERCMAFLKEEQEEFGDNEEPAEPEDEVEEDAEEDADEDAEEEVEEEPADEMEQGLVAEVARMINSYKAAADAERQAALDEETELEEAAEPVSDAELPGEEISAGKAELEGEADSDDELSFIRRKRRHSSSATPPRFMGEEERGRKKFRIH